jgi:hypothetical protein
VSDLTIPSSALSMIDPSSPGHLRVRLSLTNFLGARADSIPAVITIAASPVPSVAVVSNAVNGVIQGRSNLVLFAQVRR